GGYRKPPEVDRDSCPKYDTPAPMALNLYVLFQYLLCLIGTAMFLFNADRFSLGEKAFITAIITLVVVNCGVLFEQRRWVKVAEWIRIFLYPALLSFLTALYGWSPIWHIVASSYFVISTTWFYSLHRRHEDVQMA